LREKPHMLQTLYLLPQVAETNIEKLAKQAKISVCYKASSFFENISQKGVHQGVAADVEPFFYASLQDILRKDASLLLILDEVMDPRNLGALLRTAEAVGVGGIILTKDRSAPLSATVEKVAVGATAYLSICRVENLSRAIDSMKEKGYWIVGLVPNAEQTLYNTDFPEKIAVLLGGEEKGLRVLTRKKCDFLVALPMHGKIGSLNVSVAGAVTLYEFLRRELKNSRNRQTNTLEKT